MKKVIVRLEGFGKNYGKKEVIRDINLEVYEGEFLTLLGSSGCGKTTILRSISGLDIPASLSELKNKMKLFGTVCEKEQMDAVVNEFLNIN